MRMLRFKSKINIKVFLAEKTKDRMLGLMGKSEIDFGLLILRCNSIQTCFMKEPIEVIFLSRENKVIKVIRNIKPWRFTRVYLKASKVLELPKNSLNYLDINIGDHLSYEIL